MAEDESPKTPVVPREPVGGPAGLETVEIPPVAKSFVCARCRKGKLDPTGLKIGDWMACPDCGHRSKVTLEHVMGEERASRRAQAKKTFEDMDDEEKAEFLAGKNGLEKFIIFVKHKLGPKGVVIIYLTLVVLIAALVVGYNVAAGHWEFRGFAWWKVILWLGGGAAVGVAGHFGYVTLMYYYRKNLAEKSAGSGRRGSRRGAHRGSVRRLPASSRRKPDANE